MNTCKSCRYWEDLGNKNSFHGECGKIDYIQSGDAIEDQAQMSVFVLDDSGLNVKFITMADFGCTLWIKEK